jgi:hypothetical protein
MSQVAFFSHVEKELRKELADLRDQLCRGQGIKDYAEYRHAVGRIQQMETDIERIKEEWSKFNPDEV